MTQLKFSLGNSNTLNIWIDDKKQYTISKEETDYLRGLLSVCICKYCGHTWDSRGTRKKRCPHCGKSGWETGTSRGRGRPRKKTKEVQSLEV